MHRQTDRQTQNHNRHVHVTTPVHPATENQHLFLAGDVSVRRLTITWVELAKKSGRLSLPDAQVLSTAYGKVP